MTRTSQASLKCKLTIKTMISGAKHRYLRLTPQSRPTQNDVQSARSNMFYTILLYKFIKANKITELLVTIQKTLLFKY